MAIYRNFVVSKSGDLIISGQTPEKDGDTPFTVSDQVVIVLEKILAIIAEQGFEKENILKMNVYITDASYVSAVRDVFTALLGDVKPAMTLVVVAGLVNDSFKIEVDAHVEK